MKDGTNSRLQLLISLPNNVTRTPPLEPSYHSQPLRRKYPNRDPLRLVKPFVFPLVMQGWYVEMHRTIHTKQECRDTAEEQRVCSSVGWLRKPPYCNCFV